MLPQVYLLNVSSFSSDIPLEVCNEISDEMWPDLELGHNCYFKWKKKWEKPDDYPHTYKYLTELGIEECLIHWDW